MITFMLGQNLCSICSYFKVVHAHTHMYTFCGTVAFAALGCVQICRQVFKYFLCKFLNGHSHASARALLHVLPEKPSVQFRQV